MRVRLLVMLAMLWLAGCVTPVPAPEPRELDFAASPEATLAAAMEVLMDRGYVIRHADGDLARVEAVLARWPGYRVQLQVGAQGADSRVGVTASRGGRPMAPHTLDPLLVELQDRLGLLP
ncbi:hypothetical protein [Halomonas heilongjiangensis]|uniref:DUF4136 domain-containing protein n=1 Tax=Halomonas heilongjiangensis TaxID=1387883 RepID=A0A2N7TFV4_9GAMM|nr:hypothetical protein [Halomonas heilongjiangensis]PMR67050.1 hypothetical protein C1H66_21380 [Halomonas heilongjiangensis]PXX88159.1 hypothetical protein CR158_15010 [Halomonas heilongjiangensis]